MPISDERSDARATLISTSSLPGGVTRRTFAIDTSYANQDITHIPNTYGGAIVTITGFSGTIAFDSVPSAMLPYQTATMSSLSTSAPAIPLPAPWNTSGTNLLSYDSSGLNYGYWNPVNGQVAIVYSGKIVNNFYSTSSPLRFTGLLTANFKAGDTLTVFHTAGSLMNGEQYQTWSHEKGDAPFFKRGDANNDGTVDISDSSKITGWLFYAGPAPDCLESADTNDDGVFDISDSIRITNFLFTGGPRPEDPGPWYCSPDPTWTAAELGCAGYHYQNCP